MSLFTELRRRNVLRVAVAYLVASWLLLQVADVLMGVLDLPEFVGRAVFLLLVIGFIPAMVFAWVFELTPEGLKRDAGDAPEAIGQQTARKLDVAVIVMLVAVAALVVYDRRTPEPSPPVAVQEAAPPNADETATASSVPNSTVTSAGAPTINAVAPPEKAATSLAVLAFANMSPDPDNEYFADGISEELLNVLVDVDGLRVPSRTSSFAFKGTNTDIREIAERLQVDHVLEGSVRKAGDRVRVTAQLIDVTTDTHLWSETYDRQLEDIFAIQDEIARNIVRALDDVLQFSERDQKPTENLEAYNLYLRGRHLFQQREAGLTEAERSLRKAVELDPAFAEAWGTLAATCVNLPGYLQADRAAANRCAVEAAERALELEPGLAEATLALAQVRSSEKQWLAAIGLFESVVRQHPNLPLARLWYGVELLSLGYLEAALVQLEAGAALDPSDGVMLDWLSRGYVTNGQLDRAIEPAKRAIGLGRHAAGVPIMFRLLAEGDVASAGRLLDLDNEVAWGQVPWMLLVRDDPERLDEALAWLDSVRDDLPPRYEEYHRMSLLLAGGSAEQAFSQIERVMQFDASIGWLVWIPSSHRLLGSEAMDDFVRAQGYATVWQERGAPDLCEHVGGDQYECEP